MPIVIFYLTVCSSRTVS